MLKHTDAGWTEGYSAVRVPMRMNKEEIEQLLQASADALKAVIAQIDLD